MARFVDLDDDDGEAAPMPGQFKTEQQQLQELQQREHHLLLLRKLRDLPVTSDGHSFERWPKGFYDRINDEMDGTTFRSPATDAMQCYP